MMSSDFFLIEADNILVVFTTTIVKLRKHCFWFCCQSASNTCRQFTPNCIWTSKDTHFLTLLILVFYKTMWIVRLLTRYLINVRNACYITYIPKSKRHMDILYRNKVTNWKRLHAKDFHSQGIIYYLFISKSGNELFLIYSCWSLKLRTVNSSLHKRTNNKQIFKNYIVRIHHHL